MQATRCETVEGDTVFRVRTFAPSVVVVLEVEARPRVLGDAPDFERIALSLTPAWRRAVLAIVDAAQADEEDD